MTVRVNALAGLTCKTCDLVTGGALADAAGFALAGLPAGWGGRLAAGGGNLQLQVSAGTRVRVQ